MTRSSTSAAAGMVRARRDGTPGSAAILASDRCQTFFANSRASAASSV